MTPEVQAKLSAAVDAYCESCRRLDRSLAKMSRAMTNLLIALGEAEIMVFPYGFADPAGLWS
jgi:hypothetical protein